MTAYEEFISAKANLVVFDGIEPTDMATHLFPHQRDLARWALKKGRAAVFADTGLGKTSIQLEWARHVSKRGRVLILAPLAVASQTVREGERFGVAVKYSRHDTGEPIIITNYEMLSAFNPADFIGVVLDESSILKSYDGKTRTALIEAFKRTPYRLAATATPAPNDHTELGNHSEFLGIRTRTEMLSEYFVHDGETTQEWRIKGHAVKPFWAWVSSWGAVVRSPSDLGYEDARYKLPPLRQHDVVLPIDHASALATGFLFAEPARSLSEQRAVRRGTLPQRVAKAAELAGSKKSCIIWCELNDESSALADAIDGAIEVKGSDELDYKEAAVTWFIGSECICGNKMFRHKMASSSDCVCGHKSGRRVLVSKPSIFGFGLNFQHCATQIFVGASHSYEQTYQAIRRSWRFGQVNPVDVHVIRAETEQAVVDNYRRKEADAERMSVEMISIVGDMVRSEVSGATCRQFNAYDPNVRMVLPAFLRSEP